MLDKTDEFENIIQIEKLNIMEDSKYSNCNNNDNGVYKILKCKMDMYNKYCR